jgi:hypothetical protein
VKHDGRVIDRELHPLFGAGKVDVSGYDFTVLDTIMPHPDYAPQAWICVLSPSDETFRSLQPMLAEAYDIAKTRNARRKPAATA